MYGRVSHKCLSTPSPVPLKTRADDEHNVVLGSRNVIGLKNSRCLFDLLLERLVSFCALFGKGDGDNQAHERIMVQLPLSIVSTYQKWNRSESKDRFTPAPNIEKTQGPAGPL